MAFMAALGAIGQAGLGAGANIGTSALERYWAQGATHSARKWAEKMRSTQYQTAVQDLKAAGLNPMLAYTQGGAGTPSVATQMTPGVDVDVAGDMAKGASTAQSIRNAQAVSDSLSAGADKAQADATTAKNNAIASAFEPYIRSLEQKRVEWDIENMKESFLNKIADRMYTSAATRKADQDTLLSKANTDVTNLGGPEWKRAITRKILDALPSSASMRRDMSKVFSAKDSGSFLSGVLNFGRPKDAPANLQD